MTVDRADLAAAAMRKAHASAQTMSAFVETEAPRIAACAAVLAEALRSGGRIFTMGNGGSACDAQHFAVELMHPIVEKRRPFPATALSADPALCTAIGNDRDFALVFAAQLRLLARRGDVAVGISTSGDSANVHRGLKAGRELGMITVGLSGKDGGRMVEACDHCFVVPSFNIHRIQESHVLLLHVLWDLVHLALGEEDVL